MNCKNCGSLLAENALFCPECGTKVVKSDKMTDVMEATEVQVHDMEMSNTEENEKVVVTNNENTEEQRTESAPWFEQPSVEPVPWYEQTTPVYSPPVYAAPSQEFAISSAPKPVSKLLYILMMLINAIPLVGLIVHIICWATAKNKSFKNFCGAVVILWIIGLVLSLIACAVLYFVFKDFFTDIIERFADGNLIISIKPLS